MYIYMRIHNHSYWNGGASLIRCFQRLWQWCVHFTLFYYSLFSDVCLESLVINMQHWWNDSWQERTAIGTVTVFRCTEMCALSKLSTNVCWLFDTRNSRRYHQFSPFSSMQIVSCNTVASRKYSLQILVSSNIALRVSNIARNLYFSSFCSNSFSDLLREFVTKHSSAHEVNFPCMPPCAANFLLSSQLCG
jgi:hypothetical protein